MVLSGLSMVDSLLISTWWYVMGLDLFSVYFKWDCTPTSHATIPRRKREETVELATTTNAKIRQDAH
ncbi:hypothetical protein ACHQM5_024927 [Ranunculus cassubicifolius]